MVEERVSLGTSFDSQNPFFLDSLCFLLAVRDASPRSVFLLLPLQLNPAIMDSWLSGTVNANKLFSSVSRLSHGA